MENLIKVCWNVWLLSLLHLMYLPLLVRRFVHCYRRAQLFGLLAFVKEVTEVKDDFGEYTQKQKQTAVTRATNFFEEFVNQNGRIKLLRVYNHRQKKIFLKQEKNKSKRNPMENNVRKLPSARNNEKEKSSGSSDDVSNENKMNEKVVNSWDRSTSSRNGVMPNCKSNDWDSSSDCHETLVEPFDNNVKDSENWDSESDKGVPKPSNPPFKDADNILEILDSIDISEFSDIERSSISEMIRNLNSDGVKNMSTGSSIGKSEDLLYVEDLEEFVNDNEHSNSLNVNENQDKVKDGSKEEDKVRSNRSEGTAEDTTIWMIPQSERTQSAESDSKLSLNRDREDVEKLDELSLRKTKSYCGVEASKSKKRVDRSCRSDSSYINSKRTNCSTFLAKCEGVSPQKSTEIKVKDSKGGISECESFDKSRPYFAEYECRTITTNHDAPDKAFPDISRSAERSSEEIFSEANDNVADENNTASNNTSSNNDGPRHSQTTLTNLVRTGPTTTPLDVLSLPDMTGRNSIKERQGKDKVVRRVNSSAKTRNDDAGSTSQVANSAKKPKESWYLLDESGQYQPVTRSEVTILLNGRSAYDVLQEKTEHVIPNTNFLDTQSSNGSISNILTKESLQYILREEDKGGEGTSKKLIDLERKVENTLLYIQPSPNLTASIRLIPVDTEMIHIWRRRGKDCGSLLSSECDLGIRSQDSFENADQRNATENNDVAQTEHPPEPETPQQVENKVSSPPTEVPQTGSLVDSYNQPNRMNEYTELLIETRAVVDKLTNHFSILQSRLDGEMIRSSSLQEEVSKLRKVIKILGKNTLDEQTIRELVSDHQLSDSPCPSLSSLKTAEGKSATEIKGEDEVTLKSKSIAEFLDEINTEKPKTEEEEVKEEEAINENEEAKDTELEIEGREENEESENDDNQSYLDPGCITVNVYTMEHSSTDCCVDKVQKTNSLLQTNLSIIEGKMKTLQQENEIIAKQNQQLKRKLKEISLELEKYLASTSEVELPFEDEKEMDTLRDQVCNLKLELDNLKREQLIREQELRTENALTRTELEQKSLALEECSSGILETIRELENSKSKLEESGIIPNLSINFETVQGPPRLHLKPITSFIEQTTETLFKMHNENIINQEVLKEVTRESFLKRETSPNIIDGLDQVITGYTELIDQCRKSSGDGKDKVMEDYFTVIMEKASLVEEIKILKTENEMLMESQLEHYEKLKQTMIALKDKKNEIVALESTQKLSEEERSKMMSLLQVCEDERRHLKDETEKMTKIIEDLMSEKRERDLELSDSIEKLKGLEKEVTNFEKSCRLKDELIGDLKLDNGQLLNKEEMKNNQIEILKEEIKNLKTEKKQFEMELESMKLYVNDSQKEMTEYITHLETVINNTQESLEKTKQKLKETNQSLIRLKNENEILDKQHQCDVKLYNKTKEELETVRKKLTDIEEKLREVDEERENMQTKLETVLNLEKEKSQELDAVTKERKILLKENSSLKEKLEMFSRDKDESLKDQKDLINKYAILSKEVQKFQEKYRNVKTECNKRTDLIKYLEMMLRENLMEYNNRILCLEKNISHIIEKIAACKNCMKEKHLGVDTEVRELRHQLEVTYQERRELENVVGDYYSVLKRLESEIQEKEKKMDELHVKLSQEQQKAITYENNKSSTQTVQEDFDNSSDVLKIKKLENQILTTENELLECRKQLHQCETNHENEKKKLELTIADLKSELNRYQIRNEVMMKNLSSCNKTLNGLTNDKRNTEGTIKNFQAMIKEIDEKGKKIIELNEKISSCRVEVKMRESDLENLKTKNSCLGEEVKYLKDQLIKLQDALSDSNKNLEVQQREKNEMAEKLLQSIKLIMEERSTRQTLEALTTEKEKNFKEQIDHIKNELASKIKECETLSSSLEDKKKYSNKLQDDLKKMKSELISLRKRNFLCFDSENHKCCIQHNELPLNSSSSLSQIKPQNITAERLESCLRELKEVREINLQLRKTEGQYQAKIVCLEDEIRDARLLIKELQGDLKTEKKSKKLLKNMITSAKMEIEKCLVAKQLMSTVADRIKRHLDLLEVSSRELLSGFRSSETQKSPLVVD